MAKGPRPRLRMLLALLLTSAGAHAALNVPLTVTERLGVARVDEPVLFGVPIPQAAAITSTAGLGITTGSGSYVPADVVVTSRWGGAPADPTKPIKWVLVAFKASVGAGQTATYALTDVTGTPPSTIALTQGAVAWTVDTGAATFEIATNGFDLFHRVTIAGNDVVPVSASNGPYLTVGGTTYRAGGTTGAVSVFRQGSNGQTLTLKVKAAHRTFDYQPGSSTSGTAANDLKLNTFLTFTAGSATVKVEHSIHNTQDWVLYQAPNNEVSGDFRNIGSPNSQWADEVGLRTDLALAPGATLTWAASPSAAPVTGSLQSANLYQDSSGESTWQRWATIHGTTMGGTWQKVQGPIYGPSSYVSFRGYKAWGGTTPWHQTGTYWDEGDRFSGYLDVGGSTGGVTVAVRDMAADFPRTLRFRTPATLEIALFPADFRARHNFRVGEQKSQTIVYRFHAADADPAKMARAAAMAADPLRPVAPPSWFCEMSRVVPTVSTGAATAYRFATVPGDPTYQIPDITPAEWDAYLTRHITGPGSSGYTYAGLDAIVPLSGMSSWMDHGDIPIDFEDETQCGGSPLSLSGQYGWKYDGDYGLLVSFVRSGDLRFLDHGLAAAHHTADIDTMHHGVQGGRGVDHYLDGGMFGHEQHDDNGDTNPHRNGNYFNACYYGGWNGTPTSDMIYGAGAMALGYWLTGDGSLLESLGDIGDWTVYWAGNNSTDDSRSSANTLNTLAWAYEATGDPRYRNAADAIIGGNGVLQSQMISSFIGGYMGQALGHYVALLHEAGDTSQDGALATVVSQVAQSYGDSAWDLCRADAYAYAAMLLSSNQAANMALADASFANGARYPAFRNNIGGISNVWQVKEWVLSLRCAQVYQLATYLLNGGPGYQPSGGDYLAGQGLGPSSDNRVRVFGASGQPTVVDFDAYAAGQWGANVAPGNVDLGGDVEILTGPGPGAVYGPQARAFKRTGTAMGKINFYAYGTLRYGVNVAGADLDGDGFDEILTGAGPGAVFGPHVRAFDFDGATLSPIAKISFFAYGTLKYGVNDGGGDVEGDGYAELVTGPGPGLVFGPQVRAFDFDGGTLSSIAKINFNAFATPQLGANVAAGNPDGDGFDEIGAAPGPGAGAAFPARFRGYDFDGASIAPMAGFDELAFSSTYGGRLGFGDVGGGADDDLVVGPGRDPAAPATVKAYTYPAGALVPLPVTFNAFTSTFGVNVGAADYGY